jgi:UDP-N-acetylmuramoyl-L-alanyl-D-glutamate--2,6-diaminopimelate ligase
VGPGGLFAALRGTKTDGHRFIDKAVQNGATAIVCETVPEVLQGASGTAFIHVCNARRALAHIAALSYGNPSDEMTLVGITGTNGKTTTAWLVAYLLQHAGQKTGLISTIDYRIGSTSIGSGLTTPDALSLQHALRRMREAGCEAAVMEVSSHALDQHRIDALHFDVAVFTNLTRDHLDYHGSFENYLLTKKRLFDELSTNALSIYNAQDQAGSRLVADTKSRKVSFGLRPGADFQVEILDNRIDGLQLKIDGRILRTGLIGSFNALNVAAAYAVGCGLDYEPEIVADLLEKAPPVPGRFEVVPCRKGITVVVDYAHTPDALKNALEALRETRSNRGRIWCVFGCGGDRDRGKRPMMGKIASELADLLVVTSDNPRTENPLRIIDEIREGIQATEKTHVLPDRKEAIRFACAQAETGDVLLIAGKGHETYQQIGDSRLPFDDRAVVRHICANHMT